MLCMLGPILIGSFHKWLKLHMTAMCFTYINTCTVHMHGCAIVKNMFWRGTMVKKVKVPYAYVVLHGVCQNWKIIVSKCGIMNWRKHLKIIFMSFPISRGKKRKLWFSLSFYTCCVVFWLWRSQMEYELKIFPSYSHKEYDSMIIRKQYLYPCLSCPIINLIAIHS